MSDCPVRPQPERYFLKTRNGLRHCRVTSGKRPRTFPTICHRDRHCARLALVIAGCIISKKRTKTTRELWGTISSADRPGGNTAGGHEVESWVERGREHDLGLCCYQHLRVGCLGFQGFTLFWGTFKACEWEVRCREKWDHPSCQLSRLPWAFQKGTSWVERLAFLSGMMSFMWTPWQSEA